MLTSLSPALRSAVYTLVAAVLGVLVVLNVLDSDFVPNALNIVAIVLGTGAAGLARANVQE